MNRINPKARCRAEGYKGRQLPVVLKARASDRRDAAQAKKFTKELERGTHGRGRR